MKLSFHGGAREVGRSCVQLETNNKRYLFDAGVKFLSKGFAYPEGVFEHQKIDAVFLSHAHLDHSGALPLFENKNMMCPIIGTAQTKAIAKILLKDSYKVARIKHLHPAYSRLDIKKVFSTFKVVDWNKKLKFQDLTYRLYNAGHIPGSASIEVRAEGKNILYTGDFNTRTTRLMKPADTNYEEPIHALICESTYGDKELPPREEVVGKFKERIWETIEKGGSVLIPVFALGRSQEILIMLAEEDFSVPIYLDGMCKELTRRILSNPSRFVNNKNLLANGFFNKVQLVSSDKRRKEALSKQGIFVTTSGMLEGGPVMSYLGEMWSDEKSSILLMGFQAMHTNGRHLIDEGYVYIEGGKTYPKCHIEKFEFSGHLSREDIQNFVKKVNPKHVFFVHGDPESIDWLTDWAKKETDCIVHGPSVGDEVEL